MPANPGYPPGYVSQRKAVALALAALGDAAANAELVRWVKDHHGHDVTKYISQFKSAARHKAGRPKGRPARRVRPAAPTPTPAAPPAPDTRASAPPARGLADDLTALARLAAKYGADEVRGMLGALEAATAGPR